MGVYARIEFIGVNAWIKFIYVYAGMYRCICMQRFYMYVRVFIGEKENTELCLSEPPDTA